jgi:Tat protein translocase TatB subunit
MALIFGMGGGEIALIFVIALIVLGPKKLPEMALTIGKTLGELKRATGDFQREFMRAQQEVNQFKDETIAEAKKGLNIPPRPGLNMDIPSEPQPRIASPDGERVAAANPTGPAFRTPGKNEAASSNEEASTEAPDDSNRETGA